MTGWPDDPSRLDGIEALLPATVREIADVIGLQAALKLVELRGGVHLVIPGEASEEHWLAKHIGMEALTKLAGRYAHEQIELPLCADAVRWVREQHILEQQIRGASVRLLARQHGYTARGMRKLLSRAKKRRATTPSGRGST